MNLFTLELIVLIVCFECVLPQLVLPLIPVTKEKVPEDANLNFVELSKKYGEPAEEYQVTTDDGYILTMHHIPGKLCPVFLQHGILDTDDTFILRGYQSMAIVLAKAGYDVWLGNARGNKYSRKHTSLNPDTDKKYWNFSLHEMGYYDLPAMIDFVLNKTGVTQIVGIGHSQGNAIFYVMGATRPEYNDKIKVLIALAPVAFLHHVKPPVDLLIRFAPMLNNALTILQQEELFNDYSSVKMLVRTLCTELQFKYELCAMGGLFLLSGADPKEFEKDFMNVIFGHYPAGISRKDAVHLSQIAQSGRFQHFDYGSEKNLHVYGRKTAPDYDLSKVTMRVELFTAKNDKLSTVEDVNILKRRLPNAVFRLLERKQMNHLAFVWGKRMEKYLFPLVFKVIEKYCGDK